MPNCRRAYSPTLKFALQRQQAHRAEYALQRPPQHPFNAINRAKSEAKKFAKINALLIFTKLFPASAAKMRNTPEGLLSAAPAFGKLRLTAQSKFFITVKYLRQSKHS